MTDMNDTLKHVRCFFHNPETRLSEYFDTIPLPAEMASRDVILAGKEVEVKGVRYRIFREWFFDDEKILVLEKMAGVTA